MTCFFCALRARSRCSFISLSNPATSTVSPRSRAISSVRSSGKPCPSHRVRFDQMVAENLRRRPVELSVFNADALLLLRLARGAALLVHHPFDPRHIDGEPALARHQLRQIEREALLVVEAKGK